jgi:uncharacterized protein YdhG (YjbR/CyaY superfamily)
MENLNQKVDKYIDIQIIDVQRFLIKIREIILAAHPEIIEDWAYGMPAYKLNKKPLVYFAVFKNHIGFYATPTGHEAFAEKLAPYKQGKGSVQFPFNQPIPFDLIQEIVLFRVNENLKMNKS